MLGSHLETHRRVRRQRANQCVEGQVAFAGGRAGVQRVLEVTLKTLLCDARWPITQLCVREEAAIDVFELGGSLAAARQVQRVDENTAGGVCHVGDHLDSLIEGFDLTDHEELQHRPGAGVTGTLAERCELRFCLEEVRIGADDQHVARAELTGNVDDLEACLTGDFARANPDDFCVQRYDARIIEQTPDGPGGGIGPGLRVYPDARRGVAGVDGRLNNTFGWAFRQHACRQRQDPAHLSLVPTRRPIRGAGGREMPVAAGFPRSLLDAPRW